MKKILFICLLLVSIQSIYAQGFAINTTGANPNPSAMLDVADTSKGILIPRMTLAQRNAIPSPANSLLIYQTDSASRGYYYYDSLTTSWIEIGYQRQVQADSCISIVPQPTFLSNGSVMSLQTNTKAYLGQVNIPRRVLMNKITIMTNNPPTIPGKAKIALYAENGQSKVFEVITDSIISNSPIIINLNVPVLINPGFYYVSIMSLGNLDVTLMSYTNAPFSSFSVNPAAGNILLGYLNVAPDTLPATFNPSIITFQGSSCLGLRIN